MSNIQEGFPDNPTHEQQAAYIRTPGPIVAADMLRGRLVRWREAVGLTQEEVAQASFVSASLLSRIESGQRRPKPLVVRALLEAYNIDPELTQQTMKAVDEIDRKLKEKYSGVPEPLRHYADYEAYADTIRGYYGLLLPDVIWTDSCAEAVTSPGDTQSIKVSQLLRERRLEYLTSLEAPKQHMIIGEVALRTAIATPGFSKEALVNITQAPRIAVQIVEFAHGAHALHGESMLSSMDFNDPELGSRLYTLEPAGPARVSGKFSQDFSTAFQGLASAIAEPKSTAEIINRILETPAAVNKV